MMNNQLMKPYASILETSRIINREDTLGKIKQALEDSSHRSYIFYITANGGAGKTRLLREVLNRLTRGWVSQSVLFPKDPVDLYHIETRSEEGLALKIANGLNSAYFQRFSVARQDFARKKYQIKGSYRDIIEKREEMMRSFKDDYDKLYEKYDRILVALDTSESWIWLQDPDRFQESMTLKQKNFGSSDWVLSTFLPSLQKSVVLIAGRLPKNPEDDHLGNTLRQLEKTSPNLEFHACPLDNFTEEQSLEYFQVVEEDTRNGAPEVSSLLRSIVDNKRRTIHHLTRGMPLLLAMSIDYLTNARQVAPLFQVGPEEARERTETNDQWETQKKRVQRELIQGIQETHRPLDLVIQTLGWLPKGLSPEMMAWIEAGRQPSKEQTAKAEEFINELTQGEKHLTFIKIRPEDNRVFLHDELYDLYEKIYRQYPSETEVNLYKVIGEYYRHAIQALQDEIGTYLREAMRRAISGRKRREFLGSDSTSDTYLMDKQVQLQSLMVEDLFYTLRRAPIEGFQKYIHYAEEAFQSLDETFWIELVGEVRKFFANPEPWWTTPTRDEVEGEIGIGWIRYGIMRMEYQTALGQAQTFSDKYPELFKTNLLLSRRLNVWVAQCLVYLASSKEDLDKAEGLLKASSTYFETQKSKDDFVRWLASTAKADAEINLGYLYRSRGRFKKAIEPYRRSIFEYRDVKNEAGQANALNNLAWAEAEAGMFGAAWDHCQDGLTMRKGLQHPSTYAYALSLNTLGLIKMRDDKAADGEKDCRQALEIFRMLEEPRGIGLACTALSETIRRSISEEQTSIEVSGKELRRLKEALIYAQQAVDIFNDLKEPLRRVEAHLELGCVYREMGRFMKTSPNRQLETFSKGRKALEIAADVAKNRFEYRMYDALVNLAFLYYYSGFPNQAEDLFNQQVLMQIEHHYQLAPRKGHPKVADPVSWYWVQLGKGYFLLGRISFDCYATANESKDKSKALECLDSAVKNWVLSLEYNAMYGADFRDMRRSKTRIYECMKKLNIEELNRALEVGREVKEDYHLKGKLLFFDLLMERFGMQVKEVMPPSQE